MIAQNERLQEPRRVCKVPLARRSVRVGLDRRVGITQRFGQRKGQRAGGKQPLSKPVV
jgi:hypothetical protein